MGHKYGFQLVNENLFRFVSGSSSGTDTDGISFHLHSINVQVNICNIVHLKISSFEVHIHVLKHVSQPCGGAKSLDEVPNDIQSKQIC